MRETMYLAAILTLSGWTVWGAPEAEKTAAAVNEVLRLEFAEDVADRGELLRPVLEQHIAVQQAHWAQGDVLQQGIWRGYSDWSSFARADEKLMEYRDQRDSANSSGWTHRDLADWCRMNDLVNQERAHLWQLLQMDPSQSTLWKRLGYEQIDGRWVGPEQAAAADHASRVFQQNVRHWQSRAASIAERLASPQTGYQDAARLALAKIDDPAAIPAFELALTEVTDDLAREFVAWVRRFDSLSATFALARQSVFSPWQDVRELAIDGLRNRPWGHFIPGLLDLLADDESLHVHYNVRDRIRIGSPLVVVHFRRELRDTIEIQRRVYVMGQPQTTVRLPRSGRGVDRSLVDQLNRLNQERTAIDARLQLEDRRQALEAAGGNTNYNSAVEAALRGITGATDVQGPKAWWQWWAARIDTPLKPTTAKGVVEVEETVEVRPPVAFTVSSSCLPAGTLVQTELGAKPIETVRIGDMVLSKDVESGELAYRVVLHTTIRAAQPLVRLSTPRETIESNRGHHFWVSGKGWRMAREIQPGDRLHGVKGTVRITDVSTGDTAEVYNLVVDRANTYFVGESLVLSHDVTYPTPTDVKVPGLAAK